eukprot:CAMPEP_0172314788 /NCGR_PEP_ID=MMETSP1058-20130122/23336_1 /TAXON_ID=83371 /ORGANISM="Detonula confervacea, Strain CCMP 353" /LENGTH=538 /DNA_ID=CAMNT_0013028735 /DNA_START=94 /DNA_END=1710 /DNA_ORIENTATION=-
MAPPRRSSAAAGGGGKKRSRSKLTVDLSGHGGKYEDAVTNGGNTSEVESEDDDFDNDNRNNASEEEEDSEDEETVDAKRLRLAREYLSKMEAQESSSEDGSDEEDDAESDDEDGADRSSSTKEKVGKRIAQERLRKSGLLQSHLADSILEGIQTMRGNIASKIGIDAASQAWMGGEAGEGASAESYAKSWLDAKYVTYHRGHDLTPTCVSLSQDGHTAYSGAKDGSLIMWNVEEGRKMSCVLPAVKHGSNNHDHRNQREILSIATSDDDRYMAVGGRDNCVRIFDIRTLGKSSNASSPITTLEGHKKAVTALAFRSRTLDLYSGSEDRCIRRYDLNAMTYVETLYGHQSPIAGMACANKNRPVSIARDRTVRVWKVEEDSHLVFRPGGDVGSAECVTAIQDGWFVTGHDDGRLALWKEEKKRPVGDAIVAAHGYHGGTSGVTRSVMCCDALGLSDVLATGSNDGYLRLWKVNTADKEAGIKPLDTVPIHGHINSIAMGPGGKFCVAAVGQEPRLGRWDRVSRAKNRFAIIRLNSGEES